MPSPNVWRRTDDRTPRARRRRDRPAGARRPGRGARPSPRRPGPCRWRADCRVRPGDGGGRGAPAGVPDAYQGSYFGEGRDALGDREGRSGYARYDRIASNADIAGWLLWRNFRVATALDVGCATGFLVEVLRERGIDAQGCDLSAYAIDHATPGAVGHVRVANLFAGLPWPDGPSTW